MQIEKVYEPQRFEPHWAQWWIDSDIFRASPENPGRAFSLVIPPPNVTGILHIGHMLEHTEIDVTVRWHRMLGDNTLWLPGTDHAGIATQMVVARQLKEEGINYRDLGREKFEERVWQWKAQSGDTIKRQMVRLGASCDWSRERFTLDPGLSRAVREVFVSLYEKGLLYRGEYMVNWCPHCHTALSDLEVAHADVAGHLWHIRYPVNGMPGRYLTVATTRPETMLGDTAVAINAKDARYLDLHGKTVQLPLMDREIPIILDDLADPEFGTGVVKVTPAHDLNDFEAGKRHNLPKIQVIDENAMMTAAAGPYASLDRFVARKAVVADLEKIGALVKVEDYKLSLGKCDRCKTAVEPLISTQWFVKTKPLAEKAIAVVESGEIGFVPANWTKTYYEWMYNIRDWCISRQLWWGHRIPAWHCGECKEIIVARETPTACPRCNSADLKQDTDVLDTWFSSGLWPFSTLGWPDQTADLATLLPHHAAHHRLRHPLLLGRPHGHAGLRIHGRDPLQDGLHPRPGPRRRPPEDVQDQGQRHRPAGRHREVRHRRRPHGAAAGRRPRHRYRAHRRAHGKLPRLRQQDLERRPLPLHERGPGPAAAPAEPTIEDRWIVSRLNAAAETANRAIEQYRYHEFAQELWKFFWHEFCDWYLELKKVSATGWGNAVAAFETALRLLHPAMPFLTEELWQRLDLPEGHPKSIALAPYPQYRAGTRRPRGRKGSRHHPGNRHPGAHPPHRGQARSQAAAQRHALLPHRVARHRPAPRRRHPEDRPRDPRDESRGRAQSRRHSLHRRIRSRARYPQDGRRPRAQTEGARATRKEHRQLRSASSPTTSSSARPRAKVVDSIRAKLADYEAQLAKNGS